MMRFKGEKWELFGDDHQRRRRRLTYRPEVDATPAAPDDEPCLD